MNCDTKIQDAQRDLDLLLTEIRQAGGTVKSPTAISCCFHDDRSPSAGTYQDDAGAWRFKCHTASCGFCGDVYDVRAKAQGRDLADVLREARGDREPASKPVRTFATIADLVRAVPGAVEHYAYTSPETGRADLVVIRAERREGGKTFRQAHQRADGMFVQTAPPKPWPLFNRTRVARADRVIVVEGERCVMTLHERGFTSTTSPAGSGNADKADWSPLAGKTVVIWPDNDDAGAKYADDVVRILAELDPPASVSVIDVEPLDLPAKGDVFDFVAREDPAIIVDLLDEVIDGARGHSPADELEARLEDTISGRRSAVPWPWHELSSRSRSLLPGTSTVVCGLPGASKSFMVLEAMLFWLREGVQVAGYFLEDEREYHTHRALAQLAECGRITDDEWVRANGDAVRSHFAAHRSMIDRIGGALTIAGREGVTHDQVIEWAERKLAAGARIIVVDPVTALEQGREPWNEHQRFINTLKKLVSDHQASAILVTHPRKNSSGRFALEDLAGGAAWSRFAHTVLWLQHLDAPEDMTVISAFGRRIIEANRVLHISKSRNGPGQGSRLAFSFNGTDLRFVEHGTIIAEGAT